MEDCFLKNKFKVVQICVDDNMQNQFYGKLSLMSDDNLYDSKDFNALVSYGEDGSAASIAFISHAYRSDLQYSFQDILPFEDYRYIIENIAPIVEKDGVIINCIESIYHGTGAGTAILDVLKDSYEYLLLYSDCHAELYWEEQNFKKICCGTYIWSKNNKLDYFI